MADVISPIEELSNLVTTHVADTGTNPHQVSKSQIAGLDMVDNTSDADKPVSLRLQAALDAKVSIADIYDKTTDDGTVDNLKKTPLSAHAGMSLAAAVASLDPENWDEQIQSLDDRTTAVETWDS